MKKVTLNTFQKEVMQNPRLVLLEFRGAFCTACTMMEPLLAEEEGRYGNKIDFLMADADHEEMLNTLLNVRTLPAVFVMKNGKVLGHYEGFLPHAKLDIILQEAVKGGSDAEPLS